MCSMASFPLVSDRRQGLTDRGLSESSLASGQAAQAGSQTKGVVSLAQSLLFGCLWQQDPNNLDMWLYLKKTLGMGAGAGVWAIHLVEEPR